MEAHPSMETKDFVTFFRDLTDTVNIVAELLLDVQRLLLHLARRRVKMSAKVRRNKLIKDGFRMFWHC